jgi:hypothetical protein
MAGNYCRERQPLELQLRKDGPRLLFCQETRQASPSNSPYQTLYLVAPDGPANFWVTNPETKHVMALLRIGRSLEVLKER